MAGAPRAGHVAVIRVEMGTVDARWLLRIGASALNRGPWRACHGPRFSRFEAALGAASAAHVERALLGEEVD